MFLITLQMALRSETPHAFLLALYLILLKLSVSARIQLADWRMIHKIEWDSTWLFLWLHRAKEKPKCVFPRNKQLSQSDTWGSSHDQEESLIFSQQHGLFTQ